MAVLLDIGDVAEISMTNFLATDAEKPLLSVKVIRAFLRQILDSTKFGPLAGTRALPLSRKYPLRGNGKKSLPRLELSIYRRLAAPLAS